MLHLYICVYILYIILQGFIVYLESSLKFASKNFHNHPMSKVLYPFYRQENFASK